MWSKSFLLNYSYRQIFKSTGLLGSVQVLYVLTAVVRNKVAALLIGAAGIGLVDLYQRATELVGNFTNCGLGISAVRRLSEESARSGGDARRFEHLVRLVRTWVAVTALLGGAVCALLAPVLSLLLSGTLDQALPLLLLSPVVAFTTLAGGEMALLKALHRLRRLAAGSAYTALSTLALCCALYFFFGLRGIVPMLLLTTAASFLFFYLQTRRLYPFRVGPFRLRFLRAGVPMLRLGGAYVLAGVCTALAEMLVRAVLMRSSAGLETVGLYVAGFTLASSYARIVFVALDADYFPRLTAAMQNVRERNLTINRQVATLTVLMAPFLLLFCLCLPLVVRLLYASSFLAICPMVLAAAAHMYFRAIYLPIAYLPLAAGHSLTFMVMEMAYDGVFCVLVILGFHFGGLLGAGLGLSLAHLYDLCAVSAIYARRYGYRMNRSMLRTSALLFLLLLVGILVATQPSLLVRAAAGCLLLALMLLVARPVLKRVRR